MPSSNKPNNVTEGDGKVTTAAPSDAAASSEIQRLEEQVQKEHGMYLRALADFDNYRRRVERERVTAAQSGKRDVILAMIEALDSFDRALSQISDDANSSVVEGLKAIQRRLLSVLEAQGVTPYSSIGEKFNPELHEAIGSVKTDAHEPGTVADEPQRGYRWGEAVLRPARVRVAQ